MALVPKIDVCFDCCDNKIIITDVTGDYNATTNTGGWGSPNNVTSDVSTSVISITDPNGNVTSHTLASLPDSTATLTAADLVSGATVLTDGQYFFTWTITMSDASIFTAYANPFSTCVVENCVTDKVADFDPDCGCNDSSFATMKYVTTFESLKAAISCGKTNKANSLFTELQSMCNNNCQDC